MEAKKDIGKAIREKLDSLDRQPGDALWDAISTDLDKKKKSKFPFFWFYIVSCTVTAIVVTAFVFSNLGGTGNDSAAKPNDSDITTTTGSGVTEGLPAQEKNDPKNVSGSKNPKENINITTESVSETKNTTLKNNSKVSVTTTQKNKTSQRKDVQRKNPLIKSGNDGYAVNNTNGNSTTTTKNRKQHSKHSTGTVTNIQKNTGTSKRSQSQQYTQADTKSVSPSVNSHQHNDSASNTGNSNSTISQTGDGRTSANANAQATTTTTENDNSYSDKENRSSSIDTKNLGELNTLAATDSSAIPVDSLKTAITDNKKEEKKEDKKDSIPPVAFKKFSVYAYGGPSYFSFPERTIVTDSTTSNINTKSTTRFGVLFGYRLTNKLSIRTGISLYKLKQSASNIKLSYYMETTPVGGAGIVPPPDFTWIDYTHPFGMNSSLIINTLGDTYSAVINIDRELSYLEVPLEISYNLFDRKFGLNVFGGGSMLLLNKNKVTAYNEKGEMYLGEWNAAKKTSFSGVLGLGLNYKITPYLQLNAEPVFNYYFNTYNDSKPYSFTIRVGLQYNFDF